MRNSGDGCAFALTLCKYDLRKGDLFVLRWQGWGGELLPQRC